MPKEPSGIEKRLFSTVPTKALFNAKLTALEWRVLGLIGLHDGMTLLRHAQGKSTTLGAGCTASNLTLAREAQCSYAALVRAVKSLELHGLIQRHDRRGGHTEAAMRVRYDAPDNVPDGASQYDEPVTLDMTDRSFQYDENDHSGARRPAENCDEQPPHYSPLRGELNSAEAGELNSTKWRDVAVARRPGGIICQLAEGFNRLPYGAKVAKVEAAFNALDRDVDAIPPDELKLVTDWLLGMFDEFPDETFGQQALRLYEEISP